MVVKCRKAAFSAPVVVEGPVSLGPRVPVNEAMMPDAVVLAPAIVEAMTDVELAFERTPSTAKVMASRTGVAVPSLSGAGWLGVKSGMLDQFWFWRQYACEASYCQLWSRYRVVSSSVAVSGYGSTSYTRSASRSTGIHL